MDAKQAYRMIRLAQTRNTCLILLTLCSCFATAHLAFIDLAAVGAYTFARRSSEAFSASLGEPSEVLRPPGVDSEPTAAGVAVVGFELQHDSTAEDLLGAHWGLRWFLVRGFASHRGVAWRT